MHRLILPILAVVLGLALIPASGHAAGRAASLKTRHASIGIFLTDSKGRTVYLFQKDKTSKSTCTGDCATNWPPLLTTGKPKATGAVKANLLGTTKRADGTTQVTYNKHPLYYFSGDKKAGDHTGQGLSAFGAKWYAVATAGRRLGGGY
jgi:predicted lipoprotein with Yx(FWY)xxD motif